MTSKRKTKNLCGRTLTHTWIRRLQGTNLVFQQTIISDMRPIEQYEALVNMGNRDVTRLEDGIINPWGLITGRS